jgi:hypothetical protein
MAGPGTSTYQFDDVYSAALTALATGDVSRQSHPQFAGLLAATYRVFSPEDQRGEPPQQFQMVFNEVYSELFRRRIIDIDMFDQTQSHRFFKITADAKEVLENHPDEVRFYGSDDYINRIRDRAPILSNTALHYCREAMNSYKADCALASSVMLGVAAECSINQLLDQIEQSMTTNADHAKRFKSIKARRKDRMLKLLSWLSTNLDSMKRDFDRRTRDGLKNRFDGIQELLRIYRNDSGHPTRATVHLKDVCLHLSFFIIYAEKISLLIDHFKA